MSNSKNNMKIKDFKIEQIVFIVGNKYKESDKFSIFNEKVTNVGRKYVTADGKFEEHPCSEPYLIEQVSFGKPRRLFSTIKDATEYVEREMLKIWLKTEAVQWTKLDTYTLEQLRKVKEILSEDESKIGGDK